MKSAFITLGLLALAVSARAGVTLYSSSADFNHEAGKLQLLPLVDQYGGYPELRIGSQLGDFVFGSYLYRYYNGDIERFAPSVVDGVLQGGGSFYTNYPREVTLVITVPTGVTTFGTLLTDTVGEVDGLPVSEGFYQQFTVVTSTGTYEYTKAAGGFSGFVSDEPIQEIRILSEGYRSGSFNTFGAPALSLKNIQFGTGEPSGNDPSGPVQATPEPFTMSLTAAGLGLAVRRRLKQRA